MTGEHFFHQQSSLYLEHVLHRHPQYDMCELFYQLLRLLYHRHIRIRLMYQCELLLEYQFCLQPLEQRQ